MAGGEGIEGTARRVNWAVFIPVLVALLTIAGSVVGLFVNAAASLAVEQKKLQSQLIAKAAEVRDPVQVLANLRFLRDVGLIPREQFSDTLFQQLEANLGRVPRALGASPEVEAAGPAPGPILPPPTAPSLAPPGVNWPQSVFVQFAGSLRREDIRQAMMSLGQSGWRVQGAALGGERIAAASGKCGSARRTLRARRPPRRLRRP